MAYDYASLGDFASFKRNIQGGALAMSWYFRDNAIQPCINPAELAFVLVATPVVMAAPAASTIVETSTAAPIEVDASVGAASRAAPTLYWHATEEAVESANLNGLLAHGPGNGGKYWASTYSSEAALTNTLLLGGTQNVRSLIPFSLAPKGAFESVYTLTEDEAALFSRAWGPQFSWNPYVWYKGAFGQYYYQSTLVTWGQCAVELGQAGTITSAVVGGSAGVSYLVDQR